MQSYILIVRVLNNFSASVGSLGKVEFCRGYYMYVGSAKNGIHRVCRHFKKDKKLRWHIDYLTTSNQALPVCAYLFNKEECELSKDLAKKYSFIKGFGCSDCKCKSHLYYCESFPVFRTQVVLPSDCFNLEMNSSGSLTPKT